MSQGINSFARSGNEDPSRTPAFIFSIERALQQVRALRAALTPVRCQILYSVKACNISPLLEALAPEVDGFSVSSTYEAQLVGLLRAPNHYVHIISPGLSEDFLQHDIVVTHAVANSIGQWRRLKEISGREELEWGIRLNPGRSIVKDARYDACRKYSKLGIPLRDVAKAWARAELIGVRGLHIHNGCLCESWTPLLQTVAKIASDLNDMLPHLEWINLGGGYVWNKSTDLSPLLEAVDLLTTRYGLHVFIEPGAGIVNSAGCLVASVVDLFERDGKKIAVLDTTVNHMPEVFEYQFEPDIAEHVDDGPHEYVLAGCSCLAGDLFGQYAFDDQLEIGSRVTFENVGAYTLVKANMFNGINLPSIYALDQTGTLELIKEFSFDDFANRCGFQSDQYANS